MRLSLLLSSILFFSCNYNYSGDDNSAKIENWDKLLRDYKLESSTAHVFIAFDSECPLCKWYKPVIAELSQKFADTNLHWTLVRLDLENADSMVKLSSNIQEISNSSYKLAESLAMTVTPEVVFTDKAGIVLYRGKIDDRAHETGKHKATVREKYLENALVEWRAKKKVQMQSFTKPIGCFIEYASKN